MRSGRAHLLDLRANLIHGTTVPSRVRRTNANTKGGRRTSRAETGGAKRNQVRRIGTERRGRGEVRTGAKRSGWLAQNFFEVIAAAAGRVRQLRIVER